MSAFLGGTLGFLMALASTTTIPGTVSLGAASVPPLAGLEARLVADAVDGRLDDVDFVSAALIASGVADDEVLGRRRLLLERIAPAREHARAVAHPKARGERLLSALHDTVLRRYVERQSRIDRVIVDGEFNCLSSAVVFAIAADGLLERPRGMLSQTHAFIRVDVDGRPVDVETTTARGFAVDRRTLVTREFLRERSVGDGLSDDERLRDLQTPQEISLLGLIAGLYSNRGALAVREGNVDEAVIAFDRANRLATGALKTRVANWRGALLNNAATGLLRDGRAADALGLLQAGLDGATDTTLTTLRQNIVVALCALADDARARGSIHEALDHLDAALAVEAPDSAQAATMKSLRAELSGRLANGDARHCEKLHVVVDRGRCLTAVANELLAAKRVDEAVDVARIAAVAWPASTSHTVLYNALLEAIEASRTARACARADALIRELVVLTRQLNSAPELDGDHLLASCHWLRASDAFKTGDLDTAAAAYARAAVHLPEDTGLRHNRAEVELRRAELHSRAGRCDEARPLVRAGVVLSPDSAARGERLLEVCANERALAQGRAGRWEEAVAELRRGLVDAPRSEVLRSNLGDALHNVATAHLRASPRRCEEARALLPELREAQQAIAADVERACR